jgi:hypothetical protein
LLLQFLTGTDNVMFAGKPGCHHDDGPSMQLAYAKASAASTTFPPDCTLAHLVAECGTVVRLLGCATVVLCDCCEAVVSRLREGCERVARGLRNEHCLMGVNLSTCSMGAEVGEHMFLPDNRMGVGFYLPLEGWCNPPSVPFSCQLCPRPP